LLCPTPAGLRTTVRFQPERLIAADSARAKPPTACLGSGLKSARASRRTSWRRQPRAGGAAVNNPSALARRLRPEEIGGVSTTRS
jgi:hypothetical protein